MASITDEEWGRLWQDDPFETAKLLWLIDKFDWRGHGDLRTEILNLHRLAMDVFNEGRRYQVPKLFELVVDLEARVREELGERFDPVKRVLSELTDLYPESLSYDDSEGLQGAQTSLGAAMTNRVKIGPVDSKHQGFDDDLKDYLEKQGFTPNQSGQEWVKAFDSPIAAEASTDALYAEIGRLVVRHAPQLPNVLVF